MISRECFRSFSRARRLPNTPHSSLVCSKRGVRKPRDRSSPTTIKEPIPHGHCHRHRRPRTLGKGSRCRDDARSLGEVGRLGVAVDTLDDMNELFAGIDVGKVSVSMTINAPALVIMAFYLASARDRGIDWNTLRGTIQNDILKEFHAQNEFVFPPEPHVRLVCDVIEFCAGQVPQWNGVSISGYHIREAGSTAVQELAFTLADGFHYVETCMARGMDVDSFAPRLSFFFNSHNDIFEEIAKYRAARHIWADVLRTEYKARKESSWKLR